MLKELEMMSISIYRRLIYQDLVDGKIGSDQAHPELTRLGNTQDKVSRFPDSDLLTEEQIRNREYGNPSGLPTKFPDRSGLEQFIDLESKRSEVGSILDQVGNDKTISIDQAVKLLPILPEWSEFKPTRNYRKK